MPSASRRQIIGGGGAPIIKSRRRPDQCVITDKFVSFLEERTGARSSDCAQVAKYDPSEREVNKLLTTSGDINNNRPQNRK